MDDDAPITDAGEAGETPDESTTGAEARDGHGPGFRLGLLLGMLAGAAAAALFAPSSGEELRRHGGPEAGEDVAPEKLRAVLDRVRARVQEAAEEARVATHLAEEQGRARYQELTGQEE